MSAAALEELLGALGLPPGEPSTPLELTSLAVVQLVDLIEATTGRILTSEVITRAVFHSRASLLAMLEAPSAPQNQQ